MPDSLLITHGNTFTLGQRNEQIPDGAIYVEGDTIVEVGSTASLNAKYPGAARLDAGGKIVKETRRMSVDIVRLCSAFLAQLTSFLPSG
jgi:hypothetical protein